MPETGGKSPDIASRLYGPNQSRFARYLEQRERKRPDPVARELRRRLLAGLRGRVLEVGCGDGRSFEHYPTSVTKLLAVEPDPTARAVAADRARTTAIPIDVVEGTADALPAADGSVDAVVSMGVLCTVHDPAATLAEVRRILSPTGELHFWEHVRSNHLPLRLLQRWLDALFWTRALGGCRTTRDTAATIAASGFEFVSLDRGFHSSSPLTITAAPYVIGIARRTEARALPSRHGPEGNPPGARAGTAEDVERRQGLRGGSIQQDVEHLGRRRSGRAESSRTCGRASPRRRRVRIRLR